MKKFLIALAIALSSNAAHAASWTVDKSQSTLGFTGTQTGTAFSGKFQSYNAAIDFDPTNPAAGHAVVVIDIASATTGDKQRDEAIPQAEWFDVKTFPQAKFEATSFKSDGSNRYEAIGMLSIRGISKNVTLPFTFDIANNVATVDGKLPLIRTDYGVGQGEWNTGKWVGLDVDVTLHLVASAK